MPSYYVLRTQTEELPFIQGQPLTLQIKFFPIKLPPSYEYALIEAETPAEALLKARKRFPYLRLFLAIEEKTQYDRTIAHLTAIRNDPKLLFGKAKNSGFNASFPHRERGEYPPRRTSPVYPPSR